MPVMQRLRSFWQLVACPPKAFKCFPDITMSTGRAALPSDETDNAGALANWAIEWNGLIDVKITAIMDDETMGAILTPRAEAGEFD